jgi:hypothetical protein
MHKIFQIIVVVIILIVLIWFFNHKYKPKPRVNTSNTIDSENSFENFKVNSQNYVYNNSFEVADRMDYSNNDDVKGMYKSAPSNPMGHSQQTGVGQNSGPGSAQDVYDNRGFKWSANAKDPEIDEFTRSVDDAQLRNQFERMYMLDPAGSVAKYDITYNKISPNCCPAQYSPPFKLTDKDSSNCDFAQKYVANQYSGMNFNDGYGCACITPKQADFFGSRGGNTD